MRAPPDATLIRSLGVGAAFEVALLEHRGEVAIGKRPRPNYPPHEVPAIERERRLLEELTSPRTPRLLAAGEDDAGPYVIEQLIAGETLRDAWGSFAVALDLVCAVTELQRETRRDGSPLGWVHADLHPHNLIVDASGRVHVIDFSAAGAEALGIAAIGRGTFPFSAPELCREEAPPSPSTDRYATALCVLELLLGAEAGLPRPTPASLVRVGEDGHDLGRLDRLEPALRGPLRALLAFDPRSRPPDLGALQRALRLVLDAAGDRR